MSDYSTRKLIFEFENNLVPSHPEKAERLFFTGTEGLDVYNLTAPFYLNGKELLAARGEPRENHDSKVYIFHNTNGNLTPLDNWKPIPMEDPFFLFLNSTPCLGGVETSPGEKSMIWRTVLYDISSIESPVVLFRGPEGMKDVRMIEYTGGDLGIFTRPQGGKAGRGTCGYMEADSLKNLNPEDLAKAPLISSPDENSWEGINQIFRLDKDNLGLLGHVAWMEEGEIRHYYAAVSVFNQGTKSKTPWRVIARRNDLPPGPAKRDDLTDVLFPGGIRFISKNTAVLYLGVSDAQAWKVTIPNPFGIMPSEA